MAEIFRLDDHRPHDAYKHALDNLTRLGRELDERIIELKAILEKIGSK